MPTLQLKSILRFSELSFGCYAITLTQLLFPAGFCWTRCAIVPDQWISLSQKRPSGVVLYGMRVIS